MATTNDYLMDNHRPPKEYFSPLKDIQLFSTGSHCCAQLVSFWLRAMDSPWEPNCTQHDSTDRYAIGITEVIRPVSEAVFRVGQWCTQLQATTGKANGHNVVLMRVLTALRQLTTGNTLHTMGTAVVPCNHYHYRTMVPLHFTSVANRASHNRLIPLRYATEEVIKNT